MVVVNCINVTHLPPPHQFQITKRRLRYCGSSHLCEDSIPGLKKFLFEASRILLARKFFVKEDRDLNFERSVIPYFDKPLSLSCCNLLTFSLLSSVQQYRAISNN